MAKKWIVKKNDGNDTVTQVGGPVKTGAKALDLKQRMRAQQPAGSSAWFIVEQQR